MSCRIACIAGMSCIARVTWSTCVARMITGITRLGGRIAVAGAEDRSDGYENDDRYRDEACHNNRTVA